MNELIKHPQFGEIRIKTEKGEPLFCAKDISRALGYKNERDAILKHCRAKGVAKRDTLTEGGNQELTYIDEGNLYRLILKSQLPTARKFEDWVCDEVLPAIRKYGTYSTDAGKMDKAHARSERKAVMELLSGINRRLSATDKRLIARQCQTDDWEVNKVLDGRAEDAYMVALMYARATGNKLLCKSIYTIDGAQTLIAELNRTL